MEDDAMENASTMESSNYNVDWSCLSIISKGIEEWTKNDVVGLLFNSVEDATTFYTTYDMARGFGIRIQDRRFENCTCVFCKWVCCKEGYRKRKYLDREDRKREPKAITRVGCKALFRIKLDRKSGKYKVMDFVPEHNHYLASAQEVQFLRSYRSVKGPDKAQIKSLREVGVKSSQIMDCMVNQAGGYENVGFTTKDLYNFIQSSRAEEIIDTDSEATLAYLSAKAEEDGDFFCRYAVDNEKRLSHLFWADSRSRNDYSCFGDVLVFDSTYKTNKYKMPLVILVGANHHGRTVVFGCALLPDERSETYIWVLRMFIQAMEGKIPQAVLTDGDRSMREAIETVFPQVIHRNCSWHLKRNAQANVKNGKFYDIFAELLTRNSSVEDFDVKWSTMVEDLGLQNNEWVSDMYNKRHRWAEAFFKGKFLAGMRSTQRCEGMNAYLKRFLQSRLKLFEFVRQYDRGIRRIRHKEAKDDFKSFHTKPVLTTHLKRIEEHAANVYTHRLFLKVRNEIRDEVNYNVIGSDDQGDYCMYTVSKAYEEKSFQTVIYYPITKVIYCSCEKFESMGIPCRHIFAVLQYRGMTDIPSCCIIKRWSKEAKEYSNTRRSSHKKDPDINSIVRYGSLNSVCDRLCYLASKTPEFYNEAMKDIENSMAKVTDMWKKETELNGPAKKVRNNRNNVIEDPVIVRTKGSVGPSASNGKEGRRCGHCRLIGHNKRKCPQIIIQNDDEGMSSDTILQSGSQASTMVGTSSNSFDTSIII